MVWPCRVWCCIQLHTAVKTAVRTSRWAGGYAVTPALGGRGLYPHGKLSYEVHPNLAVFLGTKIPFRPTGRTSMLVKLSSPECGRAG
jgi:hypothetical protein